MNPAALTSLIAEQSALDTRIHALDGSPLQTLGVGEALLAFGAREHEAFASLAPLLDATVGAELQAEHQQIADDLELLEWLLRTAPDSPDVAMLTASLERRMRQHSDRDGRLLARAAALQAHLDSKESKDGESGEGARRASR